jgi:ATP-dependent helicase IRC3
MNLQLRDYQVEACAKLAEAYQRGKRRVIITMPTGSGKTCVFVNLPGKPYAPGKYLVLVHRDELVQQAVEKFQAWSPHLRLTVEKAERHADPAADIVIASVPTLARENRLAPFPWGDFGTCVVDEAHHSTAETYRRILERGGFLNDEKLLLGVTATPNRADGTPLAEVYEEIVYEYSLRDCIEAGWLSDLRGLRVRTTISLDAVRVRMDDFAQEQLARLVDDPRRNQLIVEAWLDHARARQTIVFTVNIAHAQNLAEIFKLYGVKVAATSGEDPDRRAKVEAYRRGELQVIVNCNVLTEGFDDALTSCILMARPTKSGLLYQQMIGRGTRLEPGIENRLRTPPVLKPDCLVIDVVDNSTRHELATLPSLFGLPQIEDFGDLTVTKAAQQIEEAEREHPGLDLSKLARMGALARLVKAHTETILFFSPVQYAPEVLRHSRLAWIKTSSGDYVLTLPGRRRIRISRNNLLNQVAITVQRIDGRILSVTRPTVAEALAACERWIEEHEPNVRGMLLRNTTWRRRPASQRQLTLLRRLRPDLNVPDTITGDVASYLIGSHFSRRGDER